MDDEVLGAGGRPVLGDVGDQLVAGKAVWA